MFIVQSPNLNPGAGAPAERDISGNADRDGSAFSLRWSEDGCWKSGSINISPLRGEEHLNL
jgi:hypothetical protein